MHSVREREALAATRDYSTVTEVPGVLVTGEAFRMAHSRYAFAAEHCEGRDVLEIACGAGPGLGRVGAHARRVVAGDFTFELLERAKRHYGSRIPFVRFDAHALPFATGSFDVILLFEAIYYLADADRVFRECHRVLRRPGSLILCAVNCGWRDFHPSPFSTRYFSSSELRGALAETGFEAELYGGFSSTKSTAGSAIVSFLKRAAIATGLMPRTMKGKELWKRLFFGPLVAVPEELGPEAAPYDQPMPLNGANSDRRFKVIYAMARPR